MKKLFHRKKRSDPNASQSQSSPRSDRGEPGFRASLYDTTTASGLPQTGDYPIRGNDTPNVLRKKPPSRRSSISSWRSAVSSQQHLPYHRSPTPDQYAGRSESYAPANRESMGSEAYAPQPAVQRRWSRTPLPQEFSNMSLSNEGPVTATTTTSTSGPHTTVQTSTSGSTQPILPSPHPLDPKALRQDHPKTSTPTIRPVIPSGGQNEQASPTPSPVAKDKKPRNQKPGPDGSRSTSIPQTQVDTGSSSSAVKNSKPNARDGIPLHPASIPQENAQLHTQSLMAGAPTAPIVSDNSTDFAAGSKPILDPYTVAERAQSNTQDVSVSEKVAPAVVHETVHQNVHHVREELIRREIHTHDVYHRILPVIDVEVLPARHFLPVEGGGLVEISADEVPGRSTNWVLAETASQIPSDQPAPRGVRNFTAREFPGREGDEIKYTTAEGYEHTEQTWVHPPELETGARDTGQSWPMVFGEDEAALQEPRHAAPASKSPKNSRKRGSKQLGMDLSGTA